MPPTGECKAPPTTTTATHTHTKTHTRARMQVPVGRWHAPAHVCTLVHPARADRGDAGRGLLRRVHPSPRARDARGRGARRRGGGRH
eukprot:41998-Chlamydomonas_euryale.AAC.1